jgi:hypothetical protein
VFRSYDHFQVEIYVLNLGACILLRVLDQVQGFPFNNSISIVVYYFIQIIHYMFRSYDHLLAENICLTLGVYVMLRVLDQVQGFPSNVTLFQ